jgi:hypothetical protein
MLAGGGDVMKYWINTISREHVQSGIAGGFTQADHGKSTRLKRLTRGDAIVFYSPRTKMGGGDALQQFTALGIVTDDEPFQVEMTADFHPWRRRLRFVDAAEAPIAPLIDELSFITNKKSWGFPFRRGLFEIVADDFSRIAAAMNADVSR